MIRGWAALGVAGIALSLALGARVASAQGASDKAALEQRVDELEQELALVKRKLEVADETQSSKGPQPVLGAGSDGFTLRSADSNWVLKLRGYTQFDTRFFDDAPANRAAGQDTFFFRRIRPLLEGTLGGVVDFRIMPDFAGGTAVIQDAWANVHYIPEAALEFGKFKGPVGLERLQSATAMWFVERALPTQLVPNRDLGIMLNGVVREGLFSYQLGWMNGAVDNTQTVNGDVDTGDDKDIVARVFFQPFQDTEIGALQGLGVGFAATYGHQEGAPGSYKTSGQQTFFAYRANVTQTGARYRYAPQAYWYWGPFGLLTEYVYESSQYRRPTFSDIRANNSAWQVAVGWAITGENESYKGLVPSVNFDPFRGTWGAWEFITRISQLKVDDSVFDANFADPTVSAEAAKLWSVGINWYLNRNVKLAVNYDRTTFRSYASNQDRHDEGVLLGRFQLAF
ncbi:MAG TPA: porin [Myxococcota bacterium]|nr:porin [Myxococcota bacterium]